MRGRRAALVAGVSSLSIGIVTSLALPSVAAAQAAPAQPADTSGTVEEVVITGVRASAAAALEIRKNATQLQDSIVAEDIGKLPDNNVVEALQHVSGVSIIRNNVEPGVVLIRGLPDIATTLSGRQIFTSAGRFISLPDLPAELLARVDVKKSASADDLEGGIAGLIDVTLHRPFDFQAPQIAGGLKATYGTLSKKWAPNGSLLLSDRWDTGIGEVGALVDASYQKRLVSQDQVAIAQWVLRRAGVADAGSGPAVGLPAGTIAAPNSVTLTQRDTQIERAALNGSLQWRPNDNVEVYADYFYSRLRNQAPVDVNGFVLSTCPSSVGAKPFPGTNIGQVLPNGCYGLTSLQNRHTDEDTHQAAMGAKWYVNDRLTVDGELAYTRSKDSVIAYIPDAQYNRASATNGVVITLNPSGEGGASVSQPGDPQLSPNTYLNQWYDQRTLRHGDEWAFRTNAEYKFNDDAFIRSVEVGYRFNTRSAESDQASTGLDCGRTSGDGANAYNKYRLYALNSPACLAYRNALTPTTVGGVSYAQLGADAYHVTKGSFFDGKFGNESWVNMDPEWVWDNAQTLRGLFGYSGPQDFVPTNHFEVTEESHAAFAKANYGLEIFGLPMDGNFGLRVIRTKLTESGFTQKYVPLNPALSSTQGVNSTCLTCLVYTPVTGEKTDTQYLPSFNLRVTLTPGLFLRAGASKTVTRPTFAQLNPGTTLNAPTATLLGTAAGGDPDLNPVFSTNYDLDLSYYWGRGNHIGAAAFYRQVQGYIQTAQSTLVVEGVNYILSRPANFQDANISGFEVGYTQFLDFLPGFWSGFGWDVNATFIDAPFNNVAKRHVNASGIYEKGPLSLRLSYTYNSPYLIGAFSTGVQPQFTYASVRQNMDFSLNYRIGDHLTLSLDATNLLDSYQKEHAGQGVENALLFPTSIARFDRTYSVGLRFKM